MTADGAYDGEAASSAVAERHPEALYAERRAGGEVVHVEAAAGVVIVVAAWMLDPAACARTRTDVGMPRRVMRLRTLQPTFASVR
jgi:hypothetical protein